MGAQRDRELGTSLGASYRRLVSWLQSLGGAVRQAKGFVRGDLWSHELYGKLSQTQKMGVLIARSLYITWTGFSKERLKLRAAALTYMTLLSLVPALAVVFSVFAAFGGLREAQERLKEALASFISVGQQAKIMEYLDQFVGSASAIGGFGVLFLLFTALSLLSNIEKSFNDVWGLKEDRSLLRRFEAYWPLLTLGPVLFGVSLTATASVQASPTVKSIMEVVPALEVLLWLGPIALTWVGFTLVYLIMPNTKVPVRYALIGGVVAGTLWEIAKRLYAVYAAKAITYSAIYGSLGVIPLSIIWIYVSWLVALIGATIAFAAQNAQTYEPDQDADDVAQRDKERLAVALLLTACARFESGGGPTPAHELVSSVSGPPRDVRRLIDQLVESRLLLRTELGGGDAAFAPGHPAHRMLLSDVVRLMRQAGVSLPSDPSEVPPLHRVALRVLGEAEQAQLEALSRVSLAQLVAESRTREEADAEEGSSMVPGVGRAG